MQNMETTKKKILFVITKSNWGGAQRYVYDLATSLDPQLFEVHVAVGGNGLLKEKLEQVGISTNTIETLGRDINIKKELLSAKELFKLYRKIKPDIVHLNSSKAGGLGALVARLARVKLIIFTAHAWAFNEKRNLLSRLTIGLLHWMTVMLSHRTIAVSESVKEQISHMLFVKKKITVIHPGISPIDFKNRDVSRLAIDSETDNHSKIWIGIIAELHPVKGIPYAIDALYLLKEKYPELMLYIIGEGSGRDLIKKQITKRKLEDKVKLVGFIDAANVYLKAFDVFMLPSLSEAFGYVLLEAGLAEIPVIATSVGGIPEVIDDVGILVPPRNSRTLADAIEILLQDKEKAKSFGMELKDRIHNTFTIQNMLEKTLDVYTKTR